MGARRNAATNSNGTPAAARTVACERPRCAPVVADQPLILRFFMIHNMTMRIGDRLTAPIGLTSSRWMLLCSLQRREQDTTLTELSADAMLSLQNVSRMVAVLEGEGLIRRVRKPGAGRAVHVRLTPRGERACEALRALGETFHEQFLQGVSEPEKAALAQRLDTLISNLERYEQALNDAPDASDSAPVRAAAPRPTR